jgi:hypothetical protein
MCFCILPQSAILCNAIPLYVRQSVIFRNAIPLYTSVSNTLHCYILSVPQSAILCFTPVYTSVSNTLHCYTPFCTSVSSTLHCCNPIFTRQQLFTFISLVYTSVTNSLQCFAPIYTSVSNTSHCSILNVPQQCLPPSSSNLLATPSWWLLWVERYVIGFCVCVCILAGLFSWKYQSDTVYTQCKPRNMHRSVHVVPSVSILLCVVLPAQQVWNESTNCDCASRIELATASFVRLYALRSAVAPQRTCKPKRQK